MLWFQWCGQTFKNLVSVNHFSDIFVTCIWESSVEEDSSIVIFFSRIYWVNKKIKAQINIHQKVISVCHGNNLHL